MDREREWKSVCIAGSSSGNSNISRCETVYVNIIWSGRDIPLFIYIIWVHTMTCHIKKDEKVERNEVAKRIQKKMPWKIINFKWTEEIAIYVCVCVPVLYVQNYSCDSNIFRTVMGIIPKIFYIKTMEGVACKIKTQQKPFQFVRNKVKICSAPDFTAWLSNNWC